MAKTDNLTDYLTDLADGIRAKKGTTDPINPQDFRKEIESISGGGSGGGEADSDWVFMRVGSEDGPNTDASVAAAVAIVFYLPDVQSIAFIRSKELGGVAVRGDKFSQSLEVIGNAFLDGSAFKKGDYDLSALGFGTIPLHSINDFYNFIKLEVGADVSNEVLEASIVEIPCNEVADYIYGLIW